MTLLEYRIYHTDTQQGSFARAAQILHLTPSAISHAVSSMEESCGFSLFVRGKGGVSLTRSGEALYPVIRQVLSADEALTQTVGELKGVQRGKVRIGAFNSVCVAWLPQLVAEYRAKYPGVEIEIDQGTYDDVIEWIKTGVVELGCRSTESTRELAVRPRYRDRLMCVAPRGFKTRTPGVIVPEEMRAETFVVQGDATAAAVVDRYIHYLSVGIANIINCFYPEVVALSGGIANQGEALLAPLREAVAPQVYGNQNLQTHTRILGCTLGYHAGIIGAAMLPTAL